MSGPLLLWGFMGCGKSTVGRRVAAIAGVAFVDLDERIEQQAGTTVATIFERDGETRFRQRERAALLPLLAPSDKMVVALGGGALLDDDLRARALRAAFVVTLRASVESIVQRTRGSDRPLLQVPDVEDAVRGLLARRARFYQLVPHQCDTDGRDVDDIANQLWHDYRAYLSSSLGG